MGHSWHDEFGQGSSLGAEHFPPGLIGWFFSEVDADLVSLAFRSGKRD
jgi:hypothetical protein